MVQLQTLGLGITEILVVGNTGVTATGIYAFVGTPLHALTVLNISKIGHNRGENNIGSRGAQYMVRICIPSLRQLDAGTYWYGSWADRCMLGNQGLRTLAKANWPHIQ